jgi:RNA polymerase sigma-70 factor (ECF subfamily)
VSQTVSTADAYQRLRPLMFSIAYRMLGSVTAAEDMVQEAFLRYHRAQAGPGGIESPKAFLSAVITRLCIDELRSARARRETYPGEWLPEPLLTDGSWLPEQVSGTGLPGPASGAAPYGQAFSPAGAAEQADSLSMAFLLLLERLSPVERAVFLLRDVFGYGYDEIAAIVDKGEDNCRQLALRARRHVAERKPRFEASRRKRDELAARFFQAVGDGDMDGLLTMLANDAVLYGDSGGMRPSWPRPILGRDRVSRLLVGLSGQIRELGVVIRPAEVNGQPGGMCLDRDGQVINVFALDIADGQVRAVRSVINPDKLRHLGPLADLPRLRGQLQASRPPDTDGPGA